GADTCRAHQARGGSVGERWSRGSSAVNCRAAARDRATASRARSRSLESIELGGGQSSALGAFWMTRALIIGSEAEVEIVEGADWYEARSPGRGLVFLRAVEVSLEIIRSNPDDYQPIFRNVHRAPIRRFPYGLMYTATDHEVIVIACIHGRRHPSRWKGR